MLYEEDFQVHADVTFNDNVLKVAITPDIARHIMQPEKTDLEMPAAIWRMMFAAYAVFFAGLIAATANDQGTIFVIIVSILYTFMYFGVASVLFNLNRPEQKSLFARGLGPLATYTGPMDKGAVVAQMMTIPACLALFGVAIAIFRAMIF